MFLIIQILFFILIFYLTVAFITGAPFVPTTRMSSQSMIDLAKIKKGMTVYDLGSGDGRLLFLSAQKGALSIGFEINPFLVLLTHIKKIFHPNGHLVRCYWKNFWNANISKADVVFIYLLPWKMQQLEKKLIYELSSGTRVVSNSFIFPHLSLIKKHDLHHIFVFRVDGTRYDKQ